MKLEFISIQVKGEIISVKEGEGGGAYDRKPECVVCFCWRVEGWGGGG